MLQRHKIGKKLETNRRDFLASEIDGRRELWKDIFGFFVFASYPSFNLFLCWLIHFFSLISPSALFSASTFCCLLFSKYFWKFSWSYSSIFSLNSKANFFSSLVYFNFYISFFIMPWAIVTKNISFFYSIKFTIGSLTTPFSLFFYLSYAISNAIYISVLFESLYAVLDVNLSSVIV